MKTMRLVNEKVLVTFLCSMVSLLALSSILSHIDITKDTNKVKASVNEVKASNKKDIKVDMMETYLKNDKLTLITPSEEEQEDDEEPVKEEVKKEEVKTVVESTPQEVKEPEPAPVAQVVTGTVGDYQAYARSQFDRYGWNDEDFNSLVQLWNIESGWNPASHNSRSGAHGIPQALPASKMAAYGEDYMTNYIPQINWGLDYISGRYGNPTNAYNNLQTKGWY